MQDTYALLPEGSVQDIGIKAFVVETVDDVDGGTMVAGIVLHQERLRVDIIVVVLAALHRASGLWDTEYILQRGQLIVNNVRVEVGIHVQVQLVAPNKVAQLALAQGAMVPCAHAHRKAHALPQQRHGCLVVDTDVHHHPELGALLYSAASKGASNGVAGEVLNDFLDVVDEGEVEHEVTGVLALVATQCANGRRGPVSINGGVQRYAYKS